MASADDAGQLRARGAAADRKTLKESGRQIGGAEPTISWFGST